jgi:hypothetical protein
MSEVSLAKLKIREVTCQRCHQLLGIKWKLTRDVHCSYRVEALATGGNYQKRKPTIVKGFSINISVNKSAQMVASSLQTKSRKWKQKISRPILQ